VVSAPRPRLLLFFGLLLSGCGSPGPAAGTFPGNPGGVTGGQKEILSQGLAPLARFRGDWAGTSESMAGTLSVVRRIAWIVRGSWLLEQNVAFDPSSGEEVDRGGAIYTYDLERGLMAIVLGPFGQRYFSQVKVLPDGETLEVTPLKGGFPKTRVRNVFSDGKKWRQQVFVQNDKGEWTESARLDFTRKGQPSSP